ncbi:MAG: hypothetical protein ACP5IM_06385 [Candidatus Bathyarchaeia archaeon]
MKTQIGVRVNSKLWENYKALCQEANLKPNEAIEDFLRACLERGDVKSVLNLLQSVNTAEEAAFELDLKGKLGELEAYFMHDKAKNDMKFYDDVKNLITAILQILPKIKNSNLENDIKLRVEEIQSFYRTKLAETLASLEDF